MFISDHSDDDYDNESWHSVINKRLKLKTKHKQKIQLDKKNFFKENNFGNIVGYFFYPLIQLIDKQTNHLSLIDGDNDDLLLCQLLSCLGRLCIYAQNTLSLNNMVKQFLQVLKILQNHQNPGVRHAVVYAYACSFVSINKRCYDQDLLNNFIELKQWFDYVIINDNNTEVHVLAKSVRNILLKALQDIAEN